MSEKKTEVKSEAKVEVKDTRKLVSYIRVHDSKSLLGLAGNNASSTFPAVGKPIPGLDMREGAFGVEVTLPGRLTMTVIPYAGIQAYEVGTTGEIIPPAPPKPGKWAVKAE